MFFQDSILLHYPHQLAAGEFQMVQWVLRKTEVAVTAMQWLLKHCGYINNPICGI